MNRARRHSALGLISIAKRTGKSIVVYIGDFFEKSMK